MAMITPTVDSVGDVALTNSIIDKSITEIQDELVTDIREHAFYNCTALKKAVFGSVSDVDDRAFDGCTALATVDFHTSTPFGDYVFNNCSALTALILRGGTVCHAISGTLQNSGIASGNGYVYVPAALLDAYKAHGAWGQYANQIRAIEDYPEVCDPYSWEVVAIAIEKGTYKDVYAIGDCIPVDLGSEGIINMQIAAFDADTLADGSGTAAISWVAKNRLNTSKRMSSYTNVYDSNGWENAEMRTYLNETIFALMPDVVKSAIQSVQKVSCTYNSSGTKSMLETADKLWVPSSKEICLNKYETSGCAYSELFKNDASRVLLNATTGKGAAWFTRSAQTYKYFLVIGSSGSQYNNHAPSTSASICLGFCTGRTPT